MHLHEIRYVYFHGLTQTVLLKTINMNPFMVSRYSCVCLATTVSIISWLVYSRHQCSAGGHLCVCVSVTSWCFSCKSEPDMKHSVSFFSLLICRFTMKRSYFKESWTSSATRTWWISPWTFTKTYTRTKKSPTVRITGLFWYNLFFIQMWHFTLMVMSQVGVMYLLSECNDWICSFCWTSNSQ